MSERFQVDLAGMVDLLSRHLYSGPQVYLRELLQNGVDAVAARGELDPEAPARVRLRLHPEGTAERPGVPALDVIDTGIGLSADEAVELLATIGRSSKRDLTSGAGRSQYIGQFGIGLLAAFMVADQVEVLSRSARLDTPPVQWRGHADGTFEVVELPTQTELEPGSRVRLWARPDFEHWLSQETVLGLATDFGGLLPIEVALEVPVDGVGWLPRRISQPQPPWLLDYATPSARADALNRYCREVFGFTPLASIDLRVESAGLTGVGFVLPEAVAPGNSVHRVYLKRMLLGSRVDSLLPEWAFFVRVVIDATELSPTASREQLHTDEVLFATQGALAEQIKEWTRRTLSGPNSLAERFVRVHHLALRAMALTDDEVLDLVAAALPFETTSGPTTLKEVAAEGEVVYAPTLEDYRRVATVARAQGVSVVNAGYVYDADLLARLAKRPGWSIRELAVNDLVQVLRTPPLEREVELFEALAAARAVLARNDCGVLVRSFEPAAVPAILLEDREGTHQRELRHEREQADNIWSGVMDHFATDQPTRTLVLNDSAPVVGELLAAEPGPVFDAGVRSLYLTAVMLAGERLRNTELQDLNSSLGTLLGAGLGRSKAKGVADD